MTDRIDLDELADSTDEATTAERPNRGDWLWRGEGDPEDEATVGGAGADASGDADGDADVDAGAGAPADGDAASAEAGPPDGTAPDPRRVPRVPREHESKPAGIPVERGGAGGGAGRDGGSASGSEPAEDADVEAAGPHGRGADDMTTAFTYGAVTRLADPARAVAEAAGWSDWVGIVGDVEAHVINKFQRDEGVDVDFFNGSGTGPGERLADIDERSMFFAERMVVVGVAGEDEAIARTAGWEFVPLETAAEKAGWDLTP